MSQATPDFNAAIRHLTDSDLDWASLIKRVGPCGLTVRAEQEPYQALIRAIAHQQIHGKAAEAILGRFLALYPRTKFPAPERILVTEESTLRACGFSASKQAAIRDIAQKTLEGVVPTGKAAKKLSDEDLITRLTTVRGVGRWTVEMFLMFNLGRPDILPVDDFGVREGWKVLKGLPEQPKPKALAEIGKAWSPHRSVAAWYLWRSAEQGRLKQPSEVTG